MTDNKIADIRQRAENGLMDVAGQISRGDYTLGLIKARQVMEQIVRGYAKNFNIEYTDLAGTIEKLYEVNAVSIEDRDSLHEIRLLGNKAVQESYNDAQDAEKSYYMLKHQIELYLGYLFSISQREQTEERVAEFKNAEHKVSDHKAAEHRATESRAAEPKAAERPEALSAMDEADINIPASAFREKRSQAQGGRRSSQQRRPAPSNRRSNPKAENGRPVRRDQRGGQHRGTRNAGSAVNINDILKILIPIICIILLIILIKSIIPNKPKESEVQTTPVVTTTMAPETPALETPAPEPETEAPVVRYKVSGDTVNVRYADNQDRIYEQLSKGTEIGEVKEIEGSDFVKFERDGITLVVNKNYIAPIEE